MLEEDTLEIHVDSSVSNNNGAVAGKVLFIDLDGNEKAQNFQSTGYVNPKSGQLEIIACTYALKIISDQQLIVNKKKITIFTDSKYVSDKYKEAMFHWVGKKWEMKSGRPASDANEWKDLVKQLKEYNKRKIFVDIQWEKGHSTNIDNIEVHKMAKSASKLPVPLIPKNKTLSILQPKRMTNLGRLEIGSVKMEGQKISIKILDCERFNLQNLWSYKYIVTSKNSPYYGKIDKVFSKENLEIGKSYFVRFNSITNNPRIEKVYREIL